MRRASFLPIPGILVMRATSLDRTAVSSSAGPIPERTLKASLGPIPETAMSLRKVSFSSAVEKPKSESELSVRCV